MVWVLKYMDFNEFKLRFGDSPTSIAYVDATFGEADDDLRAEFLETIDESDFPPRQWVESLRIIGEWLDARGLGFSLRDRIGYIGCAAESAGAGSNLEHLPSLVHEMLERHGCERAESRGDEPA